MHCLDGFMVCIIFVRNKTLVNFYNGQWLIRDFGKPRPSIRFEYVVCIFLLLRSMISLGIDDDYDVVDVQDVYKVEKEKVLLGKRLVFTTLDFDSLTLIVPTSHWW